MTGILGVFAALRDLKVLRAKLAKLRLSRQVENCRHDHSFDGMI
jgi:hypothetical protein